MARHSITAQRGTPPWRKNRGGLLSSQNIGWFVALGVFCLVVLNVVVGVVIYVVMNNQIKEITSTARKELDKCDLAKCREPSEHPKNDWWEEKEKEFEKKKEKWEEEWRKHCNGRLPTWPRPRS